MKKRTPAFHSVTLNEGARFGLIDGHVNRLVRAHRATLGDILDEVDIGESIFEKEGKIYLPQEGAICLPLPEGHPVGGA